MATNDADLIIFTDGHGADVIFLTEFFGQRGGHANTTLGGARGKVSLPAVSAGGGNGALVLHCSNIRFSGLLYTGFLV